jgi:pantoate--beta-alanine ligase
MKVFTIITELRKYISKSREKGLTIGFVPTMGALHEGHLSLLKKAKTDNDICICSIFVNPIQFNNSDDLKKYPRPIENDINLLSSVDCDILFNPSEKEIYSEANKTLYDLGTLDKYMEGTFRPGHFNGVAVIVKKLFDIIEPNKAYFGEKDFQQLAVIKYLVKSKNIPVKIIGCSIIREPDGLAMSSRNSRLSREEKKIAPLIYKTLSDAKKMFKSNNNVEEIKKHVKNCINNCPLMKLEYFEIVYTETLEPVGNLDNPTPCVACIAVYLGNIRLIDNIKFL